MAGWRLRRCALLLCTVLCGASAHVTPHHAPCPPDSEAWRDGIPVVNCARTPPCVEETYLTLERCRSLRLDAAWPTYDPYIRRDPDWTSMRRLLHEQLRGRTLLLVGDSVTRQSFGGLLCEAARDALTLRADAPRVVAWREAVSTQGAGAWANDAPGSGGVVWVEESDTLLARHWGSLLGNDTAAALRVADVALINFGLHYNSLWGEDGRAYGEALETLFAQLAAFNAQPGKLAVWRETSMQAFVQTGSYTAGAETRSAACAPVSAEAEADNLVHHQNRVANAAAARHGVPVLPFYDTTLPRWDMRHEKLCQVAEMVGRADATAACAASNCTEQCATDCTHLCATPTLWASFAHQLSTLLATKFPLGQESV